MRDILVILNPAAHSEKAATTAVKIEALARDAEVRYTTGPGGALPLAAQGVKDGFRTIVAAGGDGTVNEVVNGMDGADVRLGILPVGTMNVFAAELGLPVTNLAACWDVIASDQERSIDLPCANSQYFVQLGGIGLDAQVVKETTWASKKSLGPLSYLISATQIAARRPPRLVVESDGERHEGSFVLIGNGRYYGGPFVIFPNARIDDGKLDVLVFRNMSHLDIVRYVHGIIFGSHTRLPDVTPFQASNVIVSSDEDVPVEVDGELIGQVPVTFRVSPGKLRVAAVPVDPPDAVPAAAGMNARAGIR